MKFLAHMALITATAACVPEGEMPRTDILRGKQLFEADCAACHGLDARGGGPESMGLGTAPPNLRGLSAMNSGVFPRDFVLATIDGLPRHNDPTSAMPEFGATDMGPAILVEDNGLSTPIPADLLAIANYLETLQD